MARLASVLAASAERVAPFGCRVEHHLSIASTNDRAAALAQAGAPEGTVVVADEQTHGRGRSGNSWFSPPGSNLYVSTVLRPGVSPHAGDPGWPRLITLAAGVALAEGIHAATGLQPSIKWPNDIVLPGAVRLAPRAAPQPYGGWRKLAGILAEGASHAGVLEHVVLGFGINVGAGSWPPELRDRAASLEDELDRPVDRAGVLVEVLASLRAHYACLRMGEHDRVLVRWRRLSPAAVGARVRFATPQGRGEGTTAGLADDGSLLVQAGGSVQPVRAGDVEWI